MDRIEPGEADAHYPPLGETPAEKAARLAWEDQCIDEGLADIEAGRTISFQAVAAWIESLGTDNELPRPQPGD